MPEVIAPSRTIAYADLADSLGVRFGTDTGGRW